MKSVRWAVLGLALLLAGLVALGVPTSAAAAAGDNNRYRNQDNSQVTQPPEGPMVSVPGVFSLWLGQGFNSQNGALGLESAQVDLPAINATATVDGFTFNLRNQSYGWDSITLSQSEPMGSDTFKITGTQAQVQGQAANYSTDLSTRIDVDSGDGTQAGATIMLSYDGTTGQPSFSVADGSANVAVGPANVAVDGLNTGDGTISLDAAQVVLPDAGVGVRIDGFTLADGAANWQALTWYGQEFSLGEVATFSDNLIVVPGPGTSDQASVGATTTFEIGKGDAANASGQLVFVVDPTTGQPQLALVNASATLGAAGWNLAVNGINTGTQGSSVDSLVLTAEPLGIQAQVSGLAVDEVNGVTFDQARFLYQPQQTAEQTAVAGFELVVDSTDAGYVVTTTTLLPTAKAQ